MSPPNAITSSRLARGNKKKKKLGDNIKLVENLRVNKRWLGKFNKIHKFRKEKMIPHAITNYRKYKETREIKKKENVYAHEFIYDYRSRRINPVIDSISNNEL